MKTLKEKIEEEINSPFVCIGKETARRINKDIKEASLKFETALHNLNTKYPDGIPVLTLLNKNKEIFGNYED